MTYYPFHIHFTFSVSFSLETTYSLCTFYPVLSLQVMNDHSGYHFPLSFSPEFHDFHHLKFHTSYGWLGVQDWIHGTDAQFK